MAGLMEMALAPVDFFSSGSARSSFTEFRRTGAMAEIDPRDVTFVVAVSTDGYGVVAGYGDGYGHGYGDGYG